MDCIHADSAQVFIDNSNGVTAILLYGKRGQNHILV